MDKQLRCIGITRTGHRCKRMVSETLIVCFQHENNIVKTKKSPRKNYSIASPPKSPVKRLTYSPRKYPNISSPSKSPIRYPVISSPSK